LSQSDRYTVLSTHRFLNHLSVNAQSIVSGHVITLQLSPFIYIVKEYDTLEVGYGSEDKIIRISKIMIRSDSIEERVDLYPYYENNVNISIAEALNLSVNIKEVTTQDEFKSIRYLEQFHYLKNKPSWGRQAYIIAKPNQDQLGGAPLPDLFGCVVLSSPALFSGPRNTILGWTERDKLTKNIDRVVRIARVIVHPDFRGLGIGADLVRHSLEYCRTRWNVKGKKPWVVETVAEMSRHHPFFEIGGLAFVGFTKANARAAYYSNEPKTLGIEQGKGNVMASVLRFKQKSHTSKPYLMASLLPPESEISNAISRHKQVLINLTSPINLEPLSRPIIFEDVHISYNNFSVWETPYLMEKQIEDSKDTISNELFTYIKKLNDLLSELNALLIDYAGDYARATNLGLSNIQLNLRQYKNEIERVNRIMEHILAHSTVFPLKIADERRSIATVLKQWTKDVEQQILNINGNQNIDCTIHRLALNSLRLKIQDIEKRLRMGAISESQLWVTKAFGVEPNQDNNVISGLNLEVYPGNSVLIIGPSGSGKSTILSALKKEITLQKGQILPENLAEQTAYLDLNFDPYTPIVDLLGRDLNENIYFLNLVGLGESNVYLKRRNQLSHGQRYRAAFAKMLATKKSVWLADEFCAFLDPVTTVVLCRGIRNMVKNYGITFIAAAAKSDYILEALKPDILFKINAGGKHFPCPKLNKWHMKTKLEEIVNCLQEPPDNLSRSLTLWLKQFDFLETTCDVFTVLKWSDNVIKLGMPGTNIFYSNLANYIWSRDWLFHRIWNEYKAKGKIPNIEQCHDKFGKLLDDTLWRTQVIKRIKLCDELSKYLCPN
jgi:ABC-type ATPase with predicted acetyltransferase domain